MTEEMKYMEFLSARQDVSVPELQKAFSWTYTEARKMIDRFRANHWVSCEVEGLRSSVNVFFLAPKEVPLQELVRISKGLRAAEMDLLDQISIIQGGPLKEGLKAEKAAGVAAGRLVSKGLIHRFGDTYYLSISRNSLKHLACLYRGYERDSAVELLGGPLVHAVIQWDEDPAEILALPIVPENLRSYVEIQLAVYQVTGKKPPRTPGERRGREILLRNLMVRALLLARDYDGKDEYVTEARRCVEVVCESPLGLPRFRAVVKTVADYLENDVSDASLRAMRLALLTLGDDFDEDDEDDDDDDLEVF